MRKPILMTVSINDTINILGHNIEGLEAIRNAVDFSSSPGETTINGKGKEIMVFKPYISSQAPKVRIPGLHVLEIYERYPCFDSSDYAYEDRYYRNFFFSDKSFTNEEITRLACMKRRGNLEFISDMMPDWALPAVYYVGERDKMIVSY